MKDNKDSVFNAFMSKKVNELSSSYSKEDYKRIFESVDELFSMMSSAYGAQWVNNFENDSARDIWVAGLIDLTIEDIANGFDNCLKEFQEYPPNLATFRKMCLKKNKRIEKMPLLSKSALKNQGNQ